MGFGKCYGLKVPQKHKGTQSPCAKVLVPSMVLLGGAVDRQEAGFSGRSFSHQGHAFRRDCESLHSSSLSPCSLAYEMSGFALLYFPATMH